MIIDYEIGSIVAFINLAMHRGLVEKNEFPYKEYISAKKNIFKILHDANPEHQSSKKIVFRFLSSTEALFSGDSEHYFLLKNNTIINKDQRNGRSNYLLKYFHSAKNNWHILANDFKYFEAAAKGQIETSHDIQSDLFSDINESIEYTRLEINDLRNKLSKVEAHYQSKIDAIDNVYQQAKAAAKESEGRLNEIIGAVAEKGISGNFEINAIREMKSANFFRMLAIIFMLLSVYVVIYYFLINGSQSATIEEILKKSVIIIALSIPATFFSRESSRHRAIANEYLRKRVYLATMEPYTKNLDKDLAHKITYEVAGKIFGGHQEEESSHSFTVLDKCHDIIKDALKGRQKQ